MALTKPIVTNAFANTVAPGPSDLFDIPTNMNTGFSAPGGIPERPALGFFNWLFNYGMNGIRWLCAFGIATWDSAETEYVAGSFILDTSDNRYYQLVGTATTGTAPHLDLTNWQPWLASPMAAVGATAKEIWAWYNAKGLRRFAIDQRGYPGGRFSQWSEDFADVGAATHSTTPFAGGWFGRWLMSGAMIAPVAPEVRLEVVPASAGTGGVSVERPSYARLTAPGGANGAVVVEMCQPMQQVGHNSDLVFELLCWLDGAAIKSSASIAVGVFDGSITPGIPSIPFESNAPKGFGLYRPVGGTNWLVYSNVNGTPGTPTNTGVAAVPGGVTYRMRFEITGSANSSDGADHCVIYLNGTKVADMNILPHIAATPAAYAYDDATVSTATPVQLAIAVPRGTANTSIADTVY